LYNNASMWRTYDWDKVTTIALFAELQGPEGCVAVILFRWKPCWHAVLLPTHLFCAKHHHSHLSVGTNNGNAVVELYADSDSLPFARAHDFTC
jgi:hypothetical protein